MFMILFWIAMPFIAYAVGSIPFGLVITKLFMKGDIREAGSGNIGATNVRRTAGNFAGLLTLVCDMLKGAVPVWYALSLTGGVISTATVDTVGVFHAGLVALAAFLGHLYPVYMKGKGGGKGVATAAGAFAVISPFSVFVSLLVFVLFVCMTSRVSAGSLAGSAFLPTAIFFTTASAILTGVAVVVAILIWMRHHANIRRLLSGAEPKI